jgi:hypothetical protein
MTNHNVETCRVKRKEDHVFAISKVIIQRIKVHRPMRYSCHIYGDMGHKIINCPKYSDMQNIFKNKGVKIVEKSSMVEPKVANTSVHMVDVNMVIARSKVTEEHVFKDREPIKEKFVVDWEEEQRLQFFFVKTIQEMQVEKPTKEFDSKGKYRVEYKLGMITRG